MIIDTNVENLVQEIVYLRFNFSKMLCLEKLYKEEADKGDEVVNTIDAKI